MRRLRRFDVSLRNSRAGRFTAPLLLLIFLTGCPSSSRIDPPVGYIPAQNKGIHSYKAVSSRGNVIAVNSRPNVRSEGADLSFWADAIHYEKVEREGMKLAAREDIKTNEGLDGVLFSFEIGDGQGKVSYLLALYVTERTIYTIEAGGPAEAIAEDLPAIMVSLRTLRP